MTETDTHLKFKNSPKLELRPMGIIKITKWKICHFFVKIFSFYSIPFFWILSSLLNMTTTFRFTQNDIKRLLLSIEKLQNSVEDLVKQNSCLAEENARLNLLVTSRTEQTEQSCRDLLTAKKGISSHERSLPKFRQGNTLYLPFTVENFSSMLKNLEIVFDHVQFVKQEIDFEPNRTAFPPLQECLILLESVHKLLRTVDEACPNVGSDIGFYDFFDSNVMQGEVIELIPPRLRVSTEDGPKTISWTSVFVEPDRDDVRSLYNRQSAMSLDSDEE